MDWSPSCNSREASGFSQLVIFIKCWAGLCWQAYKLELVDISQRNQADKFEWCVKFLRKSVGIFGYFGKFFDYGLQFSFSPVVVVQLLSCVWLFVIPGLQHVRLLCHSPSPEVCSNSCPLFQWCHPTISSSVSPFSSCLQSFPASGSVPCWVSSSHQVPKVLELQFHCYSFNEYSGLISFGIDWFDLYNDWFDWPEFESIYSSVLSLLYGLALTYIWEYICFIYIYSLYI